ncbi:MAG: penicillin-binding transpeptidase domain-containing protein, partial [Hyphomonadaceae bacterium]
GGDRRAAYYRHPDVRVGKAGLEAALEENLRGEAGWRKMIVNAFGREMGEDVAERREPRPGGGVVLTLDAELQRRAMEAFGDQSGAAVVMDTVTGDLLVMASAPGFDPNLFVNGIPSSTFRALNEDEMKPLFHKAVTGAYSPGSTFKMAVGIAAKQAGMPDDYRVSCPGYFNYGGRAFHCWQKRGHGSVDMHTAIQRSCDVFFYNAALYAGPERIATIAREFGFGTAFDVRVPNVGAGVVPDPTWWRAHRNSGWTGGLTLNYGIGQGDLLVTPLQLAVMAARIGANGRAVTPRLVHEGAGARDPGVAPMLPAIDPAYLAIVRAGMYSVCNDPGGTAYRAGHMINLVRHPDGRMIEAADGERGWAPVQIAGKTGTAQVRVITAAERARGVIRDEDLPWRLRDNALFVCFGPWHDPRYACAVIVEHGSHGSSAAAPIAAMVMRETFKRDPSRRAAAQLARLEPPAQGARA